MNDDDSKQSDELPKMLRSVRRWLRVVTVAVILLMLLLVMMFSLQFGSLVNWFAGEAMLQGGVTVGAALLGFAFGWVARRRS